MSLSGSLKVQVNFTQTKTPDNTTAQAVIAHALTLSFSDGVAAGNADVIWTDTRTLAASASETIDLRGTLTNTYGDAAVFADIRAILVTAATANTNNVNVTKPSTSPETGAPLFLASGDGIAVRPGGFFAWGCPDATGIPTVAGTADKIGFANSSGSTEVIYTVTIIGASA